MKQWYSKVSFLITRRKLVFISLVIMMGVFFFHPSLVEAAGWIKETLGGKNAVYDFETYPLDNYNLDFFVDTSWNWLPWKWGEGISNTVIYGIFAVTNILWMLNVYLCYFLGFLVQEAFELDFLSELIGSLSHTIQNIAGMNRTGTLSHGLVPFFGGLLITLAGCSVVYQGIVKQHPTQAIQQAVTFLFTFICCGVFFMNTNTYLEKANGVQKEINSEMLTIAKDLLSEQKEKPDAIKAIRENLFAIQIKQPWLVMQFGDSDIKTVGEERIINLLKESPYDEGEQRNKLVEEEVTKQKNGNLSVQKVYLRFGMVFLTLIVNIVISMSILVLVVILIASQVLFLLFIGFLPVAMIFSLFPNSGSLLGNALQKVFQLLFTKMGILLILTITFSISHELNHLSKDKGMIWTSFLQVTLWLSVSTRVNELLGWMKIGGVQTRAGDRTGRFLRGMMLGTMGQKMIRGIGENFVGGTAGGVAGQMISKYMSGQRSIASTPFIERVGKKVSAMTELPATIESRAEQWKRTIQYVPTNAQYKAQKMKYDYFSGRMNESERQTRARNLANERQKNFYEARKDALQLEQQERKQRVMRSMAHQTGKTQVTSGKLQTRKSAMIGRTEQFPTIEKRSNISNVAKKKKLSKQEHPIHERSTNRKIETPVHWTSTSRQNARKGRTKKE
ncbi:CD3337/EF1877 family mobilome membrane protein [Enterococcus hirae]